MRKSIVPVLVAALVLGALFAPSAEAGRRKRRITRKATGTYDAPSASIEGNGLCDPGCVQFSTGKNDKFVKFNIVDATGLPVSAQVTTPDQNGDGFVENVAAFCGSSKKISLTPGVPLSLFIYGHPTTGAFEQFGGPTQCAGIGTTGTVKATFTNF